VCEYLATTPEKRALSASSKQIMKRRELLSRSLALGWALLPFEASRVNAPEPVVLVGRVTDERTGETIPCSVRRAPVPMPATVTVDVQDARTKAPLGGRYEVLDMTGRTPAVESAGEIRDGKAHLQMPATARLRVQSPGYAPQIKTVFLDRPRLLDATWNYHAEQPLNWKTYETIRTQLRDSQLSFALQPVHLQPLSEANCQNETYYSHCYRY
jgi:hypothetical protein